MSIFHAHSTHAHRFILAIIRSIVAIVIDDAHEWFSSICGKSCFVLSVERIAPRCMVLRAIQLFPWRCLPIFFLWIRPIVEQMCEMKKAPTESKLNSVNAVITTEKMCSNSLSACSRTLFVHSEQARRGASNKQDEVERTNKSPSTSRAHRYAFGTTQCALNWR